ncbi:MAG: CocE/NonD family hydrolase [Pseudomonadota bacterium]|nr:CocE/NonD family hydrolase [Pseudomonadota bacterium]
MTIRILWSVLAAMLLAGCGGSGGGGGDTDSLDPPPGAETRAGTVENVYLASGVDGEQIAFTVIEPETFAEGAKYPLILHSHGYGGSRQSTRPTEGLLAALSAAGYGIISIDQRGHGESGGTIRILDPNLEGQDNLQIIDWAEDNLDWLAYRDGNLLLGATGGSYGGGFQHLIYAIDPEHRLDAIAPEVTWNDLRYSLYSGEVFKSYWATLLSLGGGANQDAEVNAGLVQGITTNTLSQEQQALLYQNSLASYCELGTLTKIDALYWQSARDTLFNLNEAYANYRCVEAQGGDVRLLVKAPGHDSGGLEACGKLDKDRAILAWYQEKLRGVSGADDDIPEFCFHLGDDGEDGVVPNELPEATQVFQVPPTSITPSNANVFRKRIPLTTIGAGGAVMIGLPEISMTVTDAVVGAPQLGDPILFVGLGRRAPGENSDTLIMGNQVRPFRGYGMFEDELTGVSVRLDEGDEISLLLYPSFAARYVGSASTVGAPVTVEAMVGLPLFEADLPQAPLN